MSGKKRRLRIKLWSCPQYLCAYACLAICRNKGALLTAQKETKMAVVNHDSCKPDPLNKLVNINFASAPAAHSENF